MRYFSRLLFTLLFICTYSPTIAQDLGDCRRGDKTIDQLINACKSIVESKNRTDREVSIAARQTGLLLKIDGRSVEEVTGYFLLSAKKGHSESYAHIGDLYRNGYKTLKPDYEKALYYYGQSSGENVSITQLVGLGEMYLNGQGVEKSIEKAISNFELVAHLDDENASIRVRLCDIFQYGKHVDTDLVQAFFWCSSAVDAEAYPTLKGLYENNRLNLEMRMSKVQLFESNKLINECKKSRILLCMTLKRM